MTPLAALFATPSSFAGDPYGGLLNQWGHYSLGAASYILTCLAWFAAFGEMPLRYWAAGACIAAYAVGVELAMQGWRGRDTIEDSGYVAMGMVTVAASVREVDANGSVSVIEVHTGALAASILSAGIACLCYALARAKDR